MKRLISFAVSAGLLALIYSTLDIAAIGTVLAGVDWAYLGPGLGLVGVLIGLSAWRLTWLTPADHPLGMPESLRLILAAGVLNMVMPSRMGDLAKAYFMTLRTGMSGALALSVSVFEKAIDLVGLLAWCVIGLAVAHGGTVGGLFFQLALAATAGLLALLLGLIFAGGRLMALSGPLLPAAMRDRFLGFLAAWSHVHGHLHGRRRRLPVIKAFSVGLWLLHLVQLWLFAMAIGPVPFTAVLALMPLALLTGLIPMTFAGIGTRDAAIVFLFAPWLSPEQAAALGLLATLRYLLPALIGIPVVGPYMRMGMDDLRRWRERQGAADG